MKPMRAARPAVGVALIAAALVSLPPASASAVTPTTPQAAPPVGQGKAAGAADRRRRARVRRPRVGGRVTPAWPHRRAHGRAPQTRLARWLARQIGPVRPQRSRRACPRSSRGRCRRPGARRPAAGTAADQPLRLARSYAIPADDPSYPRLLNWSWTYDSAVVAAAFAATGDAAQSQQLLDQLAALQRTDGSIEIAFDVATGESSPTLRTGVAAWVGLAAVTYDAAFRSDRYRDVAKRASAHLVSLQGSDGLVRGGPDVSWSSTQHNLVAYTFLTRYGTELLGAGDAAGAQAAWSAARAIGQAIDGQLLVQNGADAHFAQGANDPAQALDVQALGAMYLQGRGQPALAGSVLDHAQSTFALSGRSIVRSADPETYNQTYSAAGPFSGYSPYSGSGAPDVLWFEGTAEMRLALAAVGRDTSALDASIARWQAVTSADAGAPLHADRTVTRDAFDSEYHVWPSAAGAGWALLSKGAPAFFAAPLPPAATLVTAWTKVRGGNLVTTYPDGRVEMATVGGERRVLAGPATGADYTVATTATLDSGEGYGIWLRSTVDAATNVTGYAVQYDHNFGQVILRQRQNEQELSTPLARANVPAGLVWYGQPHILSATIKGNTLTASLDGTQLLNVPDLAAASAAAARASYGLVNAVVPPLAGSYGLRAWGSAVVHFQQVTVAPA